MNDANPYGPPAAEPGHAAAESGLAAYEPGGSRATAAIACLWAALAADLFGALADGRILASGAIYDGSDRGTMLAGLAALLQFGTTLVCAVPFCLWFTRAYRNARAFAGRTLYSPGWAAGSFFVPIINLVRPYQIAREIWSTSTPGGASGGSDLIGLWWMSFLGSNILFNIGSRLGGSAGLGILTVADLLSAGAALATLRMVRAIEARQDRCYREASGAESAAPPAFS